MFTRVRPELDQRHRRRVVRRWVSLHLMIAAAVAIVETVLIVVNTGDTVDAGLIAVLAPLGYLWGMASFMALTFGWIGVYLSPSTAGSVMAGAAVIALMSGALFYALSLFTTPVVVVAGAITRFAIVRTQRWLGVRFAPDVIAGATAS